MNNQFDVIIIGGSYAGLSAAMALGRSRRKVLIVDAGEPCNRQTPYSHNFLTQDGKTPAEITLIAKEQVLAYPTVTFHTGFAVKSRRLDHGFSIETDTGDFFNGSKLLLATGVKDIFPSIPGLKECWGISVLQCPYCHGYEVRDTKLAIIADGDMAVDFVKLIRNWTDKLVLLTNGKAALSNEGTVFLKSVNVGVIEHKISHLAHKNGHVERVNFDNGESLDLNALFTRVPFEHHSSIAADLGCVFTETNHISVDDFGKTTVSGLYAAGDCTTPMRSVSIAVGSGTKAGIAISKELIDEDKILIRH